MGMAEGYLELADERAHIRRRTSICARQVPFVSARLNVGTLVRIKPQSRWMNQPRPDNATDMTGVVTESQPRWVRVKLDNGIERTFSMARIEVL